MQCQPFNDCRFLSFFPLLQRTFSRRTNEIKCENDKQTQREEMSVPTIAPNLLMLRSQCRKKRLLSAAKRRRSAPIQRSPLGRWHSSRKGLRSADDNAAECNVCTFKLACSKHKMIWMNDERTHELSVTEDHRRVSRVCCVCVCVGHDVCSPENAVTKCWLTLTLTGGMRCMSMTSPHWTFRRERVRKQ